MRIATAQCSGLIGHITIFLSKLLTILSVFGLSMSIYNEAKIECLLFVLLSSSSSLTVCPFRLDGLFTLNSLDMSQKKTRELGCGLKMELIY
jgi:hypothetical protein